MAKLLPTLDDHDYKNWVKGGLGLKFAREGIENFVERNIDTFFHANLPVGPHCYTCSTANIIKCNQSNHFCKFKSRKCIVHDPKDPTKKSRPCPVSVCDVIRDEVVNKHRFRGPSWVNTDAGRWCREPWQLAVCYMPPGYARANSAQDTDFPGILGVVINNKVFDTEVADKLSDPNNIFCKAREARNSILHKADMTLTDAELAGHIATLDNMLSDAKCLAVDKNAIHAKALLQQILNDTIHITTQDIQEMRAEALRAIQEKKQEALERIDEVAKEKTTATVSAIQDERDQATVAVKSERTQSKTAIQDERDQATVAVKSERTQAETAIQDERDQATVAVKSERTQAETAIQDERDQATVAVKSERKQAETAIQDERDKATVAVKSERTQAETAIQEATSRFESALNISHDQNKKVLKNELLSVYNDGEHMSTSLGPGAADEDEHIDELYVDPNMKLVDHRKVKDEGIPVQSYQDIFKVGNNKIYIVGEAGTGKTSLCQKMVFAWSTWYQTNTQQKENMSVNQQAMAKFDYLFYISLRHSINDDTIDEMIKHQLLPNKPKLHEPLSRVLDEEKCLIILDGLDEWTTENNTASSAQVNRGLPGRDAVRNCTVLTTTRPWKLESLHLKSTQIDTKVELLGIDEISIKRLIITMIIHLNEKFHKQKTYKDFQTDTKDKKLDKLLTIPVILKQIVCLWHGGKQLGQFKTTIYCQMLELLLDLAKNRLDKDPQYLQRKEEWLKSSKKLPSCFDNNETCKHFIPLLVSIAELAFLTLLNDDQESSLVFKSSKEGCHNLSPEEVNICLKIGILSKDKILIDSTSQYKQICFLHKSYQEFLAAVFVSLKPKQCVKTFRSICITEEKCLEMSNVLTFISGTCTSATTCTLVQHYNDTKREFQSISGNIVDCMREGWTCSHDNKHLYCDCIRIDEPSEYLDQLCKVNIPNIKWLSVWSPAPCLQYLLQIHTLEVLYIGSRRHPVSDDILYTLVHHNRHTLTVIAIYGMTLRSNTRLPTLLHQVPHLRWLKIDNTTLPQQLLTSLEALHSPPDREVEIINLPY